jgi:hypothetical protein
LRGAPYGYSTTGLALGVASYRTPRPEFQSAASEDSGTDLAKRCAPALTHGSPAENDDPAAIRAQHGENEHGKSSRFQ